MLTAIVALVLNHRGFTALDNRITGTHRRIDDVARRLDGMQTDLKDFFKTQADFDKRLGRIKDKLGIPPR